MAPRGMLDSLLPTLRLHRDERDLVQRGYGRMTSLPNREMPLRLVVFANANDWLVQPELLEGRAYRPLVDAVRMPTSGSAAERARAVTSVLERSRTGARFEPTTPEERRRFLGSVVTPPSPGWSSGVAVSFAADAIELWPMKPKGEIGFEHECYPVAAVAPDSDGETLVHAIEAMLAVFKPRPRAKG